MPRTTQEARLRRDVHRVSLNVKTRANMKVEDELLGKGTQGMGGEESKMGQKRRGHKVYMYGDVIVKPISFCN